MWGMQKLYLDETLGATVHQLMGSFSNTRKCGFHKIVLVSFARLNDRPATNSTIIFMVDESADYVHD